MFLQRKEHIIIEKILTIVGLIWTGMKESLYNPISIYAGAEEPSSEKFRNRVC